MYVYLTTSQLSNGKCMFILPKTILDYGTWSVGLLDIFLPQTSNSFTSKYIDVLTHICRPGIVNTTLSPILNRIYIPQMLNNGYVSFDTPKYIPVSMSPVDFIDIILVDDKGQGISFEDSTLTCTLHFIQDN